MMTSKIQQWSLLLFLPWLTGGVTLAFAGGQGEDIKPSDVYNTASLVVSELAFYINRQTRRHPTPTILGACFPPMFFNEVEYWSINCKNWKSR